MLQASRDRIITALKMGDLATAVLTARELLVSGSAGPPNQIAIEIARDAAGLYREFLTQPVEEFAERAPVQLGPEHGGLIQRALQRLFNINKTWETAVGEVHLERLARELRDFTRSRRLPEALGNVRLLLDASGTGEARERRAAYIGAVLATIINSQKEAEQVMQAMVGDAAGFGLTRPAIEGMLRSHRERSATMMAARMETIEVEWSRRLVQAETDIRSALPEKNKMDEPDEALLRDVGDVFRSIARTALTRGQHYWPDVVNLLDDFIPGEVSATAKAGGVESRSYSLLGFTAKKSVLLTFQALGKSPTFTSAFFNWLDRSIGGDYGWRGVEIAGMLRTEAAMPILLRVYNDKKFAELRESVTDALGDIASEQAVGLLRDELRDVAKGSGTDPVKARRAMRLLSALGKIVRSPRTAPEVRRSLGTFAVDTVPADNTRLALAAANQIVNHRADELAPRDRQWAVRVLTSALWMEDETSALQKFQEDRPVSLLGFRAPLVDSLRNLVPLELRTFLEALEKYSMRYGAAYMAVAEVLEKTGKAEAIPLLERMLMNALRHEDSGNQYKKEYYFDPATQTRVELSRDKVVGSLIYAIGKLPGDEGRRILHDVARQIRTNRVRLPGDESVRFLMQFGGGDILAAAAQEPEEVVLPALGESELKDLVKAITGSYLLTGAEKRRIAKISALTRIGQCLPHSAIDAVVENFGDKDPLVASAAIGAMGEYLELGKPAGVRNSAVVSLIRAADSRDPAIRLGAMKALREAGPGRSDLRPLLEDGARNAATPEGRNALTDLLKKAAVGGQPVGGAPMPSRDAVPLGVAPSGAPGPVAAAAGAKGALDLKREYAEKRRLWIAGGKKGPPPEPPAGA